jgi:hypothetical protein
MSHRFACWLATLILVGLLAQMPAGAQQAPIFTPGRTPWGHPDLQGVYTFSTNTPFQRPANMTDVLTQEEIQARDAQRTAELEADVVNAPAGSLGPSYNFFWESSEKGKLAGRPFLITDPEDGRLPPLTANGERIREEIAADALARRVGTPPYVHSLINSWTDHPAYTRCLARPVPRVTQEYNHGLQVLQTPTSVVIYYESMHDTRVIPLDGRPHVSSNIRQWNGDSRGRWEGNTLVVETVNFHDKQASNGSAPFGGMPQTNMRMIERFTKVDPDTVNYEVTINDPTIWTRPFTFILPWHSDDPNYEFPEHLYEFACHEGNYRMMEDSLSGTKALKQQVQAPNR